jgi:hypothetical protein
MHHSQYYDIAAAGAKGSGVRWYERRRAKIMSVTLSRTEAEAGLPKVAISRAAGDAQISSKGWQQEAALRMLLNNLDPVVAEKPEKMVVYDGTGAGQGIWMRGARSGARDW